MDEAIIAKYPFLSGAKELVSDSYDPTDVSEAGEFVRECLERKAHVVSSTVREAKNLVLSRLMLYSLGGSFLRKFAFFKSREYARFLQIEGDDVLFEVAKDFFPNAVRKDGLYAIALVEYLSFGRNLPKAGLKDGLVFFDRAELVDCIASAVQSRISDDSRLTQKIPEDLREAGSKLLAFFPRDRQTAFKGKYLQTAQLQKILQGVGEGKRYYGAMAVAIACVKDGLPKEEGLQVMQDYVTACGKGAHPFTIREGEAVIDWVYKHPTINLSFQMLKTQGLVD